MFIHNPPVLMRRHILIAAQLRQFQISIIIAKRKVDISEYNW